MGPALIVVVDEVLVTGLAFGLESVGLGVGPFLSLQNRQVRNFSFTPWAAKAVASLTAAACRRVPGRGVRFALHPSLDPTTAFVGYAPGRTVFPSPVP